MFKKLSRVAIVTFALAVLLAVSSLAYSVNIDGTVAGLEAGVDHTVAQYDFANNAYGEFTALTADTQLTAGVWGIKAGDAEPVALFVQTTKSGKFNFWNSEKEAVAEVFKGAALTDSYVPGYWSGPKGTAFVNVTYYAGYPSVCVHLQKSAFLTKAEVAKTVTVGEVAYPLYTIDDAEYYLKEEAYYAVADNALYEGEGEAVAVTVKTWTGATPIIGEANLLAEAEYLYGFTNEQVVPASAVVGYTSGNMAMKVGSVAYKEGYSDKDFGSKVVFYTKTIGSDVVTEYTAETTTAGKFVVTAPEMPADAYVVAVGFRPYDEAPDDIFVNNTNNNENVGYYHQWMEKSNNNGLTLKAVEFDAPTGITGGILNVEGLEEGKYYQWAPVTLNSTGDGYAYGEWATLTEETEVSGLVAVRYCNADATLFSLPSDIVYVSGSAMERQKLGNFKEDDGYVICKSGTDDWIVGTFASKSAGQIGTEGESLAPFNSLDQGISNYEDPQTLWLYDHTEETALAKVAAQAGNSYAAWTGGSDPETFNAIIKKFYADKASLTEQQWAAERLAHAQKIATAFQGRNHRYTYDDTEIVPVEDVSSFSFFVRKRQGSLVFKAQAKVVFKVMDLNGNVTDYEWVGETKSYTNGGSSFNKFTVDLATLFADAEGYLVGFAIHPFGVMDVDSISVADATLLAAKNVSARFIQNQASMGWYPDDYVIEIPTYPQLEGIKGGYGKIGGLEDGKSYQYATLTINAAGTALEQGLWTDYTEETVLAGLVTVREVTRDGGYTIPTDPIYVYGDADARQALGAINETSGRVNAADATNTFRLGYWTGKSASTHSTFKTYEISTLGGGWISASAAAAAGTADAALAADPENADLQAAALAKRQALCNAVTNNWLYYGYEPDEIVSITELDSFSFTSHTRQGILYSKAYASEIAVVVALPDGTVSEHRILTAELMDGSGTANIRTVSFEDASAWTPALPEKGWVVGLKVNQWYGKTDPSAWGTSTLNSLPSFIFLPDDYVIGEPELVLVPAEADLSGLYAENGVVKGFDKNLTYGACEATVDGISQVITKLPEGTTSYELEAGLWAFRVLGDGITTVDSLPSKVFYKAGNSRGNILHTETVTCTGSSDTSPIKGLVVDRIIGTTASKTGAVEFNKGVWTATHAYSESLYTYWAQGGPLNLGSTSNPINAPKVTTAMTELEADPENTELQAKVAQLVAENIAFTNSLGYAYQYTPDEIIPMTDFVSHTFKAWCRQTGLAVKSGTFQTKYVLKVMLDDGSIVDRVVYKDVLYSYNGGNVMTVSLSDFAETDGYIVGMVIYPYGGSVDLELKKGSSPGLHGDVDVMFYDYGYVAKAPAVAPKFDMVATANGVDVVIKNALEGATYAWSLDGDTWTNGDAGFIVMNVPVTTGATVYVKMLPFGGFEESYVASAAVPAFKAVPELVLGEGNVLSDTTGLYEIAKYGFNTELAYEPLTEMTLTTGVWAVRAIGDDAAAASAPQVFYIRGNEVGTVNLVNTHSSSFIEGKWATSIGSSTYALASDWASAGKIEIHTGSVLTLNDRRNYVLKYLMSQDEIIPVSELTNISAAATAFYTGYINEGYTKDDLVIEARSVARKGQTKARVYVVGASVDYYDIYTDISYSKGYDFNIGDALADKEGYVVAIELYPIWSIYGADGVTELGDNAISACWNYSGKSYYESYTFKLTFKNQFIENELPEGETLPTGNYWSGIYANGANRYGIKLQKVQAETPVLTIDIRNVVTVSNYIEGAKYGYSTDGGETWTEFTAKTFTATKANAEYLVKVMTSANYYESEAATVTTHPLAVVGTSLVLDGQIGVRVYFDIDTDLVNIDKVYLYTTKINNDYDPSTGEGFFKEYGAVTSTAGSAKWASKLLFDEAKGLYYITVFVPAKDYDNIHLETELQYYLKATEEGAEDVQVKYYGVGTNFKASTYIANAKALAEAGNEAFVDALDLINATEDYVTYADAYFNNKTVDAYRTEATVEVEAPSRSNTALEGVEFYGTSLILEDNVTIRHYFKVIDIDAFVAAGYETSVDYGAKGDYIYFDITDIPAQELGAFKTLEIREEGEVVYTVNYSAANYMADMMDDDDANLVSLVNAMYDYYLAAADYAK